MRKIILILLILTTNINASDITKSLSNSPESLDIEAFKDINFDKATKYKTFNIPFKANPNLETLQYYFYRDLFTFVYYIFHI